MKTLRWSARASDDLESLDGAVARRIVKTLRRYAETESGDVIRLQGATGMLRMRIGDWRVLLETLSGDELRVLRVLHRSQAYR